MIESNKYAETIERCEAIIKEDRIREAEFRAQQERLNTNLARVFKVYEGALNQMLDPLRHITEPDMKPPA